LEVGEVCVSIGKQGSGTRAQEAGEMKLMFWASDGSLLFSRTDFLTENLYILSQRSVSWVT